MNKKKEVKEMIKIAPSILSANFAYLADEVEKVEKAGADLLHIDVMDGHFVPNITLGAPVIARIREVTSLPFDVHLMIEHPEKYVDDFIDVGADILTVHAEATVHLARLVNQIKSHGIIPAVALNPATPLNVLDYILEDIGMVLIMTVNPGFGGQQFISSMLNKIYRLKEKISYKNLDTLIEVDGGINENISQDVIDAGADILVAGSAIYKSPDDKIHDVIKNLRGTNS